MKHIGAIAVVIILLFGCAAKEPTAVVNEILIPKPKEGYAVVAVMRDSIRPSSATAKYVSMM